MRGYGLKQYLNDVKKEAIALKEELTELEKESLTIKHLDPNNRFYCVYGQISGDCRNPRALDLIQKCCPRYVLNPTRAGSNMLLINDIVKNVNGKKVRRSVLSTSVYDSIGHLSMIESYILTKGANKRGLINFLKGKTGILEL